MEAGQKTDGDSLKKRARSEPEISGKFRHWGCHARSMGVSRKGPACGGVRRSAGGIRELPLPGLRCSCRGGLLPQCPRNPVSQQEPQPSAGLHG